MQDLNNNIKNLENLLQPFIGIGTRIIKTNISSLTAPGDNYGSVMLKVDLVLQKNTIKEEISVIAKTIPDTELFQKIFNIQVTFKNEIAFYDTILPTLEHFKKEHGVSQKSELFPKFLGGRINLLKNNIVDEDGVIILENLKVAGYQIVNRHAGFDIVTTKLILKNMAEFHALPLAIKLKNPDLFQNNIKTYCACFHPQPDDDSLDPTEGSLQIVKEGKRFDSIIDKIEKSLKTFTKYPKKFREPFSTILHDDMWVNNIMVKFENNVPVGCKFIDFQMYTYDTPVKDLIFFLITSVPLDILKEHFDDFLVLYHKSFIKNLLDFDCDISPFNYEDFIAEIKACLETEIGHTLFMTMFIVLAEKDGVDITAPDSVLDNPDYVPTKAKEKVWWFLDECIKREFL